MARDRSLDHACLRADGRGCSVRPRPFYGRRFAQISTENPRKMNMGTRHSMAGFTLIELLVASILVAIIAAIALPAYQQQVREGRRSEARAMLVTIMNREHRFFADNYVYTTSITAALGLNPAQSENGYYNLSALGYDLSPAGTPRQVLLTATPTTKGGQSSDAACATLTLGTTGARGSTGGGTKCW
jgi:type IV pilus assembly protein PilE